MADTNDKQIRGDRLVAKVLEATLVELTRSGFENISVENVAELAEVNKTTIYRRWPTTEKLVHAALQRVASEGITVPDTGSLRADLTKLVDMLRGVLSSPHNLALLRMHLGGTMQSDLAALALTIQRQKDEQMKAIFVRAVGRGELPKGTDIDLLYDTLVGAFFYLAVFGGKQRSGARMVEAVDLILDGAKNANDRSRRAVGAKDAVRRRTCG
jgi:AcrR family transcriptional regulator